jgi:hypothetical protein
MKETSNINKSLGNVIAALSKQGVERESHINYRDCKLTKVRFTIQFCVFFFANVLFFCVFFVWTINQLLKNSIGGDSLTLLIACISPAQHNNEGTFVFLFFNSVSLMFMFVCLFLLFRNFVYSAIRVPRQDSTESCDYVIGPARRFDHVP